MRIGTTPGRILVATRLLALPVGGFAQNYPARPVHLVVPHQVSTLRWNEGSRIGLGGDHLERRVGAGGDAAQHRSPPEHRDQWFTGPGFKAKVLISSIIEATGGTPEELAAFLKADRQRFAEVAKPAAIKMD